ncbi:hypothetical protein SAMN04489742_2088 [Arthrobacter crystallopoietes]|uniref:Uncharacterized protein n=1 Tax=Crystallibacter crystallopoietes TaxID=37928 RepID=A0A1H1CTQ3_9MICC|nr:hypothetical protein SAMN04489742_2088 [Arthrobacter crystallopoietes]
MDSAEAIAQIVHSERSLERLRAKCIEHPRLRPEIAKHRAITRCVLTLTKLWPTYAEALQAPTLDEAIKLSDNGQKIIDAASEEIGSYEDLVESTRAYEDLSVSDFLDRALKALSISHPNLSLLDLAEVGAAEASSITDVPTDGGHGAQFLALNAAASVHLDANRFNSLLRETAQFCLNSPRLEKVAAERRALDGLAESARLLWESLTSFEAILLRENDEQALMRRTIKFYGEIYEDVAGPLFAWYNLLAGIKNQPYEKLIQADAAALARNLVHNSQTSSFLEDVGANLRNAAQHGNSFFLDGQRVTFNLRSYQEELTYAEVLDQFFSLLESTSAMSWSLSNSLTQAGFPLPTKEADAAYMNLSPFRLAVLWLRDRGTNVLDACETSESWSFTIDGDRNEVLELALTFMKTAPEALSEVTVRTLTLEAPLKIPFSAYGQFLTVRDDSVPSATVLAMLELWNACTMDGKPLLSTSDLKFATAVVGMFVLLKRDNSLIPHLRRTLELASSAGQPEVIDVIKQVYSQIRIPEEAKTRRLATKLNAWREESAAPTMPQSGAVTVYR